MHSPNVTELGRRVQSTTHCAGSLLKFFGQVNHNNSFTIWYLLAGDKAPNRNAVTKSLVKLYGDFKNGKSTNFDTFLSEFRSETGILQDLHPQKICSIQSINGKGKEKPSKQELQTSNKSANTYKTDGNQGRKRTSKYKKNLKKKAKYNPDKSTSSQTPSDQGLGGSSKSDTDPLARISNILGAYEISGKEPIKNNIIFDSGASVSVVGHNNLLDDMVVDESMSFVTAGGKVLKSSAKGKLDLYIGHNYILTIENVYYIDDLTTNLISLSDITKFGHRAIFEGVSLSLEKDNSKHLIVAEFDPETRLYIGISGIVPSLVETKERNKCVKNKTRTNLECDILAVKQLVDLKFPQYIANSNDKKDLFYYHLQTNHMSLRALDQLIDQGKISAKRNGPEARNKVLNCIHCKAVNSKKDITQQNLAKSSCKKVTENSSGHIGSVQSEWFEILYHYFVIGHHHPWKQPQQEQQEQTQ